MPANNHRIFILLGLALALAPAMHSWAQRVDDNAVDDAEDGFGSSIGGEVLGVYGPSDVRGFSPTDAGNVRLDGLYFDRRAEFTGRLVEGNRIRVGPSALDYAFPAPTGIADYRMRKPGDETVVSTSVKIDSLNAANLEVDALLPIAGRGLGLAAGFGAYKNSYASGSTAKVSSAALVGVWRPTEVTEIVPFWSRIDINDEEAEALVVGDGSSLPSPLVRRRFLGQPWADFEVERLNYGVLGGTQIDDLHVRAGIFHSASHLHEGYTLTIENAESAENAEPGADVERFVIADPGGSNTSTSGELTVFREFLSRPIDHRVQMSLRARSQSRRYGGSDRLALPDAGYGTQSFASRPEFDFGMQSNDAVRQWTAGVAYQGLASGIGQINVGIQKTDYRKAVETPDGPLPESRDQPWLFSAAAAIDLNARLAIYGGFTRGLEESDVAPESAVNRDTAPPAIGTRQVDAGLRWHASGKMTVIAGVFEVSKPYFGLDDLSLFRRLGDVRHRGIEASIRGTPVNGLSIVAGGVFLDASLSGEDVSSGAVGPAPAGTPSRKLAASIDWHPPGFQRLSFDLSAEHIGRQYADVRNAVVVPGRTTVDIGARYRFHLDEAPAVLRVQVTNLSDAYGWDIVGSNVFTYIKPRILSARLTVDF